MRYFVIVFSVVVLSICIGIVGADRAIADENGSRIFFDQIVPLLFDRCHGCHGATVVEGGYSVATPNLLLRPGDSGMTPVSIEHPEKSELIVRMESHDSTVRMPLDSPALAPGDIDAFRKWIAMGAYIEPKDRTTSLLELFGKAESEFKTPEHYRNPFPISSLLLSHDAESLLVAGYGEVLVWSLAKETITFRIPTRGRMISDLKWAPGGKLVVASGTPGTFGVLEDFDFSSKQKLARFGFSSDVASSLSSSFYRNEIAVGASNGVVTFYSLDNYLPRVSAAAHAAGITTVCWSNRGDRLFTASLDRSAKSFETTKGELLFAYADHERAVGGVVDTPFGPATLDETGALRIWSDSQEPKSIAKLDGFRQVVQRLVYCNGYLLIADESRVRRIAIVQDEVDDDQANQSNSDKPKKKKRTRFKETEPLQSLPGQRILSLASDANGLVAAGLANGQVVLWRMKESTKPWKFCNLVAQP